MRRTHASERLRASFALGTGLVRRIHTLTGLLVAAASMAVPAGASALTLDPIGSFERPTYVTSDPRDPSRVFVVEQAGRIRIAEGGDITTFLDIEPLVHDLNPRGDYGLFSIAFSPDFATNRRFYVAYSGVDDPGTAGDESGDWHLDEFRADGDTANVSSRRKVLTINFPPTEFHYGGQLQFGGDGYL